MKYSLKAHPTVYKGTTFRSRLEARWAAFFDLVGWKWEYEPIDLEGWTPDFLVTFPCGHSECNGSHTLLVEVKPYFRLSQFDGHPCLDYSYGFKNGDPDDSVQIPADSSAAFGNSPAVTWWEMGHGAGGGEECIENWVEGDIQELWNRAGAIVQWHPSGSKPS